MDIDFEKMGPFTEGQVLLVRDVNMAFVDELVSALRDNAEATGTAQPWVIVLHGKQALSVLTEDDMDRGGWIRKERLEQHIRQQDTASGQV